MSKLPGVFCLEGEWDPLLTSKVSVRPQLDMLRNLGVCEDVIHRDAATGTEFAYYMDKWLRQRRRGYAKYAGFPLGYMAFHGSRSRIHLGHDDLSLEQVADIVDGRAAGRIFYFGSCETMAADDAELVAFCRRTKARAIVGYTESVGWLASASFDFYLLPELLKAHSMLPVHSRLVSQHPGYTRELGFRMATSRWVTKRKTGTRVSAQDLR